MLLQIFLHPASPKQTCCVHSMSQPTWVPCAACSLWRKLDAYRVCVSLAGPLGSWGCIFTAEKVIPELVWALCRS